MTASGRKLGDTELEPICDFTILAVQARELTALLQLADAIEEYRVFGSTLYRVEISGSARTSDSNILTGVVTTTGGVGRVEAAIAASHLLHRITPRWLFLVGVAGGFRANNVALGDIIVASQIVDYEQQRLSDNGREFRLREFEADQLLLVAGRRASETNWSDNLNCPDRRRPRVHLGSMLSGDKVIASTELVSSFLRSDPHLLGVEMEGAGVAAALSRTGRHPGFLMIRGVADLANDRKREDSKIWLDCACDAAASFTIATLSQAHLAETSRTDSGLPPRPGTV
jgi:nucleoside phosphorylase